jgi:membrane-bound serine protease (ClpP class)
MTLLWVAIIFIAGCILLLSEFLLPGGVLGVLGAVMLIGGCIYGMVAVPEYAVYIFFIELLGAGATFAFGMYLIANTRFGSGLRLETVMSQEEGYENKATEADLVGQSGIVLTPLRPAGTIELDGRRLDVTANGAFIEAGKEVRVLAVNGSFITVERAE